MKKLLFTTFLLLSALCSYANEIASETTDAATDVPECESHFSTMWDIALAKKLGIVGLSLQQSVFTIDTSLERAMTIAGVNVDIIPTYLRVSVLGFYLYHRADNGVYRHLLRYHAGFNGSVPFNYVDLTWAARLESTYVVGNATPSNKLRTRIRAVGKIPESKFSPFIGVEHFLQLNTANAGHTERMWFDVGVTYKIDKNNSVEFLIREENRQLITPIQWNTNIGFTYKITL